ncbi:putative colanic acid biosynthesis UDP-glucose lipid carrier transferase [Lutibacter sp. Hel_I_33_5]|uniref:exopolysaccharide biosynthesis polyprenyl glycosylphosphotransferase n=1 Tax=Lutibacter sp. Hel_I_33_5 TaxID=1566289 RepID=UPI00119D9673|nr:exopolysaccharide biosynthesis polyprenyl glycosylphosphotransferase [Lutibacter sp. Hel_I_33_5]TVZ56183.1 putative colanic acid biosynthesis UDP-glucose lipid carrier transferase [Lutibacter sp. Hel_I_33_5]
MKKRYSHLLRPLKIIVDLIIINFIIYFIYDKDYLNFYFLSYISVYWLVISFITGFYKVYRFTNALRIFTLLTRQFLVFIFGYFAYFGLIREGTVINNQFIILTYIISSITIVKFCWYFLLNKFRSLGNNFRTTVVYGYDDSSKKVIKIFESKANLGYKFLGYFSDKKNNKSKHLGTFDESFNFIKTNVVDEIYCSLSSFNKLQINTVKKFATENGIKLKLIPNSNELYSKNQNVEFYDDTLMVLNIKKLPFEFAENYYIKRIFDIVFSILICVFVLSWLIPVLGVLIKFESNGPLVFKQKREGINGNEFVCYKFRSMKINDKADKIHAIKNDVRVTKIGSFLRKTSIDELPQFINVLLGDMSVVGPRPHLESLSIEYQKDVDDYLKRHIVKPGITGLAQISGYRGEITKKSDIKNRVRLDIFYIENWSFFLDLKIIIRTVLSVFNGDEKAY